MREADLAQGNDDFYASIAKVSTTCVGKEYLEIYIYVLYSGLPVQLTDTYHFVRQQIDMTEADFG